MEEMHGGEGGDLVVASREDEWSDCEIDNLLNSLGSLATMLYDKSVVNSSAFLMILANDAYFMKLFMAIGGFDTEFGACRALFRAYPKVVTSKIIKERFVARMKRRLSYKASRQRKLNP